MQKYFSFLPKCLLIFDNLIYRQDCARKLAMMQSKKKRNQRHDNQLEKINPIAWPSKNHCIVCFFHPISNELNISQITKDIGTVKAHLVTKKDNKTSITKIEMSNSNEAKSLWKRFVHNPPAGVITVIPDKKFKTITQFYSCYWSSDLVDKGIKNGEIITGSLRINAKKYFHAFISDETGRDILINGLKDRNRALDGDIVAVKINDPSDWIAGNESILSCDKTVSVDLTQIKSLKIDTNNESQSSQTENQVLFKHARKTGKVVALLEKRNCRSTTGHIKLNENKGFSNDFVLFSPVSSSFPRLLLHRSCIKKEQNNIDFEKILFVARIIDWSEFQNIPIGQLGEVIGKKGEVETETQRILIDHGIDDKEFSEEVCTSFPHSLDISKEERVNRKDFTKECIFSIDPSTAKDLDDALHCKEISPGVYEVGVHIADVSHFVKPETAVDQIASQRCTSVYLVQKVVPMLPHVLCEELCSLNPGSEKLAFSVVWKLTEKGKVLSEWFGKSIIKSCIKLSYDHAQSFINHPDKDFTTLESTSLIDAFPEITGSFTLNDIKNKVLILHKIAQNLRKQRFENGALQLDQVKLSYTLSDTGLPTGCYASERKASNELIEEFMLLANIAVSHKIYSVLPNHAFLRCHPEPKETMMEDFISHCRSIGLEIDSSSSGALAQSITQCCGNDDLAIFRKQALFMFAIKPQQLALYFCAGAEKDEKKFRHYALNVPLYTHFTSPIRRYADILVHRQLSKALGIADNEETKLQSPEILQKQAQLCNHRKYNSKIAQELSVELFLNLLVNNYGPFESNAMIMYVYDRSIDVLSMEYGIIKRVYIDCIPGVMYKLEQKISVEKHQINTLILKWTNQCSDIGKSSVFEQLPFNDSVDGVTQTLEIFTVVKIVLQKFDPESALSVKAVLKKPS